MADLRQRSIAEDLKNKEMRKAQSILIYGEQRYEYAKDVPYKTQMAANYAWIGWCGMLGVLARLALEAGAGGTPYTLGLTGALYANLLGCF